MLKRKDFLKLIGQIKKKGTKSVRYKDLTVNECRIISFNGVNIECDGDKKVCILNRRI